MSSIRHSTSFIIDPFPSWINLENEDYCSLYFTLFMPIIYSFQSWNYLQCEWTLSSKFWTFSLKKWSYFRYLIFLFYQGYYVDDFGTLTAARCMKKCKKNPLCDWYSFNKDQKRCIHLGLCEALNENEIGFVSGQADCPLPKLSKKIPYARHH